LVTKGPFAGADGNFFAPPLPIDMSTTPSLRANIWVPCPFPFLPDPLLSKRGLLVKTRTAPRLTSFSVTKLFFALFLQRDFWVRMKTKRTY